MSEARPDDTAAGEAVGAAVAPPDGAIVTGGGPLPDDDASSPGVDAYRERVTDADD